MKAYQRYAKLIMAQHLAEIQFIAEHTNCEAGDINTAMKELLNVHSELLDVYMKLWSGDDEVNKNVAEQDV